MAYTTANKCTFDPSFSTDRTITYPTDTSTAPVAFFYPEDINVVLAQGTNGQVVVPRIVHAWVDVGLSEPVSSMVLIAAVLDNNDLSVIDHHLLESHHMVGLGCFPFNREGGIFEPNPRPV